MSAVTRLNIMILLIFLHTYDAALHYNQSGIERTNSSGSSVTSPNTLGSATMANPYAMGSLYHSPSVQSYCGPGDNLSLAGHYSDMRSSATWYGSTTNDPRFAKFLCHSQNTERFVRVVSESASAVTDEKRLGHIFAKLESRDQYKSLDSRQNLLK